MIKRDPVTQVGSRVNDEGQDIVRAIVETELEHASSIGKAYSWDSTEFDKVANEYFLTVKNLGNTPLILDRAIVNGSNVICFWHFRIGSATTTMVGDAIVGVNLNRAFASDLADVTSMTDETALPDGDVIMRVKTPIDNTVPVNLDGVILQKGHYVQIQQITESDSGSVILFGHFENPD